MASSARAVSGNAAVSAIAARIVVFISVRREVIAKPSTDRVVVVVIVLRKTASPSIARVGTRLRRSGDARTTAAAAGEKLVFEREELIQLLLDADVHVHGDVDRLHLDRIDRSPQAPRQPYRPRGERGRPCY